MRERSPLRVLAVTHEALRNGAPIVLLRILRWLKEERGMHVETLALRGGPLLEEFAELGPVHLVPLLDPAEVFDPYVDDANPSPRTLARAATMELAREAQLRESCLGLRGFDVLYLNSASSAAALRLLPEVPPTVIAHIHELESAFNLWLDAGDRRRLLRLDPTFIVVADRVSQNLTTNHGVLESRITRSRNEFARPPEPSAADVAQVRARGDVGDGIVIGAMGAAEWRKGPDLFVQMASQLLRRLPDQPLQFVWVGRGEEYYLRQYRLDAARLGIEDRISFVGETTAPATWLRSFDVFCLTSREDPFPLVCLEAGALGVPVVCFDNGGMTELASESRETIVEVVEYLDVEGMVEVVEALILDPERRRAQGDRFRSWLDDHLFDEGQEERIADLIDDCVRREAGLR